VERLHVHYLRELVHRLRAGASQRAIAHDLGLARMTVQKYAQLAAAAGYVDASQPLPDAAELIERLGPPPQPPRTPSTVEPYREQVEQLVGDGVEMMTIFDRVLERGYIPVATRRSAASCAR
jgi:DNA-binding IclR family transcriptional regulator